MSAQTATFAAMTVADLLQMLEGAAGPDRDLDRAIWYKLVFDPELAKGGYGWVKAPGIGHAPPAFTAHLEQAIALCDHAVPALMKFVGDLDPSDMRACATLSHGYPDMPSYRGFAPPKQYALALSVAALKAFLAKPD